MYSAGAYSNTCVYNLHLYNVAFIYKLFVALYHIDIKFICKLLCFAVIEENSWNKSSNFVQVVVRKVRLKAAKKAQARAPVQQRETAL